MKSSERRTSNRQILKVPLQFEVLESSRSDRHFLAETENISPTGMFMITPERLSVGTSLQMTLQVPTEISGSVFNRLQCRGRVVHEQVLPNNTVGYGIQIEKMGRSLRHMEFTLTSESSPGHSSQTPGSGLSPTLAFRQFGSDLIV
jgi:hypothetical protein